MRLPASRSSISRWITCSARRTTRAAPARWPILAAPVSAGRECLGHRGASAGRSAATGDHGGHQRVVGACREGIAGAVRIPAHPGADERHGARHGARRSRPGVLAGSVKSVGGGRCCARGRGADGLPARLRRRVRRADQTDRRRPRRTRPSASARRRGRALRRSERHLCRRWRAPPPASTRAG